MTDVAETGRHPLLEDVHRVIADRSCEVLSLDIFDTVLWRRVPRPADVFGLLASRLKTAGLCPEWITGPTLRRMRINAEQKARTGREALGTEVSLFDIWRYMPSKTFPAAKLDDLVKAEVEAEREFTVVDLDIAEVIRLALKQDIQVILVSDTYFTEDHLNYLLDRPELGSLQGVKVYRSHQHGLDKTSGLFEIVLRDLGRSPEQVVHIGDNPVADVEAPAELGVRTVHYVRLDESFEAVLEREQEPLDHLGDYGPHIDEVHGDFGITSLRAKTLALGGRTSTSAVDTAWRYGASVIGPVLTGFAEWVAWKAHEAGTKVLWCPMREGDLLSELVNNAAKSRGWELEAKPIWLSRHVTSLAGLDTFDEESIHEFIRRSYQLTVRQLLSILHLRAGDVPGLASELNTVIDNGGIAERVSVALTETPHLQNRLKGTMTAARERLLRSLKAAGALESPDLTLVDLGWGGTIQAQLAKALRIAEIDIAPAGLYLATDDRAIRCYQQGLRAEGYLAQAGVPTDIAGTIVRSPEVLEQCVNALCGSLIGFTEDGAPVLSQVSETSAQNSERLAVQEGIRAFQSTWNRYVRNSDGAWSDLARPQVAKDRLANILVSAMKSPTAEEAGVFGDWVHEDNFGSSVVTKVIPDDLRSAIPYLSPLDLDDLHMRDSFWPALLAASDTGLGSAARALASGLIDPAIFEPAGEPCSTSLHYRTGDGKWHNSDRRRLRINHNGLSFARMRFEHHDTVDVSISLGRPAIVRIDWIEAKVIAGGRQEEQVLRWESPEDFSGISYIGSRWLGANLVEFETAEASIVLPVFLRAKALASSGQVTIAFAVLPQSMSSLSSHLPAAAKLTRIKGRLREEYRARGASGMAAGAARVAIRKLGGTTP